MGSCLTRERLRTLQHTFSIFDVEKRGVINAQQIIDIFARLGIRDVLDDPIKPAEIDFYMFMNMMERRLVDVYENMDTEEQGLITFEDALISFVKLGSDINYGERLVAYLKRIQQNNPDVIPPHESISLDMPLTLTMWLACLLEAVFSPIEEEQSVGKQFTSKKLQEFILHPENTLHKGGSVISFKSKTPRFPQERKLHLGPGEYDIPATITVPDSARKSSSFLTTSRKFDAMSSTKWIGPGAYDVSKEPHGTRKHNLCFQSSTKRFGKGGSGDPSLVDRTSSALGPGTYDSAKSQTLTQNRAQSFRFSKAPRDFSYLGLPSARQQANTVQPESQSPRPTSSIRERSQSVTSSTSTLGRRYSLSRDEAPDAKTSGSPIQPQTPRLVAPIGTSPFVSKTPRFGPKPKYTLDFKKILKDAEKNGYPDVMSDDFYMPESHNTHNNHEDLGKMNQASERHQSPFITQQEHRNLTTPSSARLQNDRWGSKSTPRRMPSSSIRDSRVMLSDV